MGISRKSSSLSSRPFLPATEDVARDAELLTRFEHEVSTLEPFNCGGIGVRLHEAGLRGGDALASVGADTETESQRRVTGGPLLGIALFLGAVAGVARTQTSLEASGHELVVPGPGEIDLAVSSDGLEMLLAVHGARDLGVPPSRERPFPWESGPSCPSGQETAERHAHVPRSDADLDRLGKFYFATMAATPMASPARRAGLLPPARGHVSCRESPASRRARMGRRMAINPGQSFTLSSGTPAASRRPSCLRERSWCA